MQRISVHISDETKQRINMTAKAMHKIESELIREAIDTGLNIMYPKSNSAQSLVALADMARAVPEQPKEPHDISEDTAHYAFGDEQ